MSRDDSSDDQTTTPPMSLDRRRFLQRASAIAGLTVVGPGSYLSVVDRAWGAEPIKVGIATDLTGAIGYAGIPNLNVAKMVVEEINAAGGLLGRPLQIVAKDTASNEQLAVSRVRELVQKDKVDVVFGGITSSMRNAIKDTIVNRGKTLYIYPQLYEGKECTKYLYCTGPTPAQQCDTFIPWLIKNGGKKFFLPSADYVWPHVLNEYARKTIVKNGGEVVDEVYFPVDHNEYSAVVNKIMSSGVNVVFNTTIPPGVATFFKQLNEAGFQKKGGRLACVYYDENALNITPANEIEGLASCLDYFKALGDPFGNKLQDKYTKLYGNKHLFTAGSASTGMWRGVNLWASAVKTANSVKREDVAAAIEKAKLADGPGGGCEVVPGTQHVAMPMYIAVAKGGKYEIVEKSSGIVQPGECA
jgi:branched-chain amino acid transport system substrate-binding protein